MHRLVALTLVIVLMAACDGDGDDAASPTGATAATGATGLTDGDGSAPTGPAPDACALISADEIEAITGTNPGVGSTSGSPERSICLYESGFIAAVEVAANYEASKDLIEQEGAIEPVPDVGRDAFWDTRGQLVALGDDFFVGVTIGATGRAAREQAIRIATVMLEGI